MKETLRLRGLVILRWATFCVLVSRAFQHFFYDVPLGTLCWSEDGWSWFLEEVMGRTWQAYTTYPQSEAIIDGIQYGMGISYGLGALGIFFLSAIRPFKKWVISFYSYTTILLLFLTFLYTKEKAFQWGQFFEHASQFGTPVLLMLVLYGSCSQQRLLLVVKLCVALTFLCHGLYAFGYYPQPTNFVDMTTHILGVDEPFARKILVWAGLLDFLVVILIFIPDTAKVALGYAVVWGGLTAFARVVAYMDFSFLGTSLSAWWWETVVRLPHAMLPYLALVWQFNGGRGHWRRQASLRSKERVLNS